MRQIKLTHFTIDVSVVMHISKAMQAKKRSAKHFTSPHYISEKANINSDSRNGNHYKSFPPTSAWTGRGNKSTKQVEIFGIYLAFL